MTQTLGDHVAEQAQAQPDATALVADGRSISYSQLQAMAAAAGDELEGLGLPTDRPVGIHARKTPETIAVVLACLSARRPFMLPSIELAQDTLDKLFAQADASRVVTTKEPAGAGFPGLDASEVPPDAEDPTEWPPPAGADDVSFMLTTSGSTGLPKIVPLPPGAIDRFTDWAASQFEIGPGTAVLNYAPLNFDLCLLDIWTTLKHGGKVVLVNPEHATSSSYVADLLTDNDVKVCQAVPMLYRLLIDLMRESGRDFAGVRHVMTTGDKIPATSLAELPRLFPNARFFNIYGCTETNDSLMHEFDLSGDVPQKVPVGQPLPGVTALIESEGEPVDGPGTGELLVWTPFQTHGYLKKSLNEDRFVTRKDGGDAEKRFYRTGDVVRRHDDGSITLEGRSDFYVKVRGVRVSTQVVEQAIQEHPEVVEVAVIALPDELAGARLHAVICKEADSKLNSLSLRKHCSTRLGRPEMPSTVEIVTEPLPKTSTGKIDRKRIEKERT